MKISRSPQHLNRNALLFLILMGIFSLFRFIFLLTYNHLYADFTFGEICRSYIVGLRLDLASAMLLVIPAFIVSQFKLTRTQRIIEIATFVVAFIILFSDLFYYQEGHRRLSYEIYFLFTEFKEIITIVFTYKWGLLFLIILSMGISLAWLRLTQKFTYHRLQWKHQAQWFVIGAILIVIGIRGGLQQKPLRPSFAFTTRQTSLAHLALNPVFTVYYSLKKGDVYIPNEIPDNEALNEVQQVLRDPYYQITFPQWPLYQNPKSQVDGRDEKTNIVILLLESFSGYYVGALSDKGKYKFTPQFDDLAKEGKLFTNFMSVYHRSPEAIVATNCSIPGYDDLQIIGSNFEQNNFKCLAGLLSEVGYSSLFLHGAPTGSYGLDHFSRTAGFDRYIGKDDFEFKGSEGESTLGAWDHVALENLNLELKKQKEPFYAMWFSLSGHAPYDVPNKKFVRDDISDHHRKFVGAISYADDSLGTFFELAGQEKYFENTIFIILSDHTNGDFHGVYGRHRVPLLIYAPGKIDASRDDTVGSQLDILPTVLDLLDIKISHHRLGNSLLDSSKLHFAFIARGHQYVWMEGNRMMLAGEDYGRGLFDPIGDPNESNNLIVSEPERSDQMWKRLYSFIQVSKKLVRDNRLAPL